MARMPRNQLLDMLFGLFREREHWPVRLLRERTQQPEAYLKEVLGDIAFMHRSGEHNGTWELMANFKGEGVRVLVLFDDECLFDLCYGAWFIVDQRRKRSWAKSLRRWHAQS